MRCNGCGLVFEPGAVDRDGAPLSECPACLSPVCVPGPAELVGLLESCAACVAAGDECDWHAGFGAGWDACVAVFVRAVDGGAETVPVGLDLLGLVWVMVRGRAGLLRRVWGVVWRPPSFPVVWLAAVLRVLWERGW